MDKTHISRSVLSITSPGTYLSPEDKTLCRKITRETNSELSRICEAHPDRFSFFASLPLPDVEGAIEEIDYALDHLGAKGFAILTNVNGVYLGDPALDGVFKKLNDRRAIVMIHPTTCQLCLNGQSSLETKAQEVVPLPEYPRPMMEFFFDTARAATNLILSKTVDRNPNITFIVPHCGSVLPPMIERFTSYSTRIYGSNAITSNDVRKLFRTRFYFDLAGFPFPDQIHGLLRFADPTRLLYGTDFPFLPADAVIESADRNDRDVEDLFGPDVQKLVYSGNAQKLLALD